MTTYDFAPGFFEDRLLRTKALRSCPNIVILIDQNKYQEICRDAKGGRQINRRYMLIPVKMPHVHFGVFHPKVWFLSGKERADLLIGSSNLTRSGITSNLEMVSSFAYAKSDGDGKVVGLFRSAYDFLQMVVSRYCSYSDTVKQATEQLQAVSPVLSERVEPEPDVELMHNLDSPILEDYLSAQQLTAAKLTVLGPYFDSNIDKLLGVIAGKVKLSSVNIIVQQDTNTLNVDSLRQWHKTRKTDLIVQLLAVPGRKLHAKVILLESPDGKLCTALIGSANFTEAALFRTPDSHGNIELCVAFRGDMARLVRDAMESEIFSKKAVSLEEIRSSRQDDRQTVPENKIILHHAELDSKKSLIKTVCHVDDDTAKSIREYSLLVRKVGSVDPDTVCKVARENMNVKGGILNFSVGVEDSSILSKSTTVAIHASTPDEDYLSNYVWLLNVTEIHDSMDRDYNKIAKQFRESGRGLIEFINKCIKHGMIDKAIDLLASLNIRFNNCGRGVLPRTVIRTTRSPITEDDAAGVIWSLTSDQQDRFARRVSDFILRHHNKVLIRHIKKPNLNGLENFFDVMETCADLGITALKNGLMTASGVYQALLHGFRLFAGDNLTEGYFRALWRKFYDVQDMLREALIRHRVCERAVAYALLLKTIDTGHNTKEDGFIRLSDICCMASTDYLVHLFDFVEIGEGFCDRVTSVLRETYDNADYCRVEFDPNPKEPHFAG